MESKKHMTDSEKGNQQQQATGASPDLAQSDAELSTGWRGTKIKFEAKDKTMIDEYNDDINGLLVFAGLFSAILTGFIIEIYKTLEADDAVASAVLLRRISMQLANNSGPVDPLPPPLDDFKPSAAARAVNVLWFSSLLLSVFAALFGIFVKQWLHAYSNWADISNAANAVRLRDFYRRSFKAWMVPSIIAMLPLLLQLALLFFVTGLLVYLWTLDIVVAGFATSLVVTGVTAAAVAILLPVWSDSCSYKSPIGIALARLTRRSPHRSWAERDMEIVHASLPNDEKRTQMRVYFDACTLLDIDPMARKAASYSLIASQVKALALHSDKTSLELLQSLIAIYAQSQPEKTDESATYFMSQALDALLRGRHYALAGNAAYGIAQHIRCLRPDLQRHPEIIQFNLQLLQAFSSYLVHGMYSHNYPRLIAGSRRLLALVHEQLAAARRNGWAHIASAEVRWNSLAQTVRAAIAYYSPASLANSDHLMFFPTGSHLLSLTPGARFLIWDLNSGVRQQWNPETEPPRALSLSPDGTRIVLGAVVGRTRSLTGVIPNQPIDDTVGVHPFWRAWRESNESKDTDLSLSFSPNSARIATGSEGGSVSIVRASDGVTLTSRTFANPVSSVAYAPNGLHLAITQAAQVDVLHANSLETILSFTNHTSAVNSITYSPDGTRLASASSDRSVRIWDASTVAEQTVYSEHSGEVRSVVFTPDGARAVSGSADMTVRVWDVCTGEPVWISTGHTHPVRSVAVSPDGLLVASAAEEEAAQVWAAPL